MGLIDTHAHLYVEQFNDDIKEVILRAKSSGIEKILLPNIDVDSIDALLKLWQSDKDFFVPMMGIHPSSINKDYLSDLEKVFELFDKHSFCAVGEIGLDYYWSKEFATEQKDAFIRQIEFAKQQKLPIAVHCRDAFDDILDILEKQQDGNLQGVLHCFTGNIEEAHRLKAIGFKMGLGGVLTFKNSGLDKVVAELQLEDFILETDSPYLAPQPHRGKRNESSYLALIAKKLAEIYDREEGEIIQITSDTAKKLFRIV
jgi:TatD DNase family protein